MSKHCEAKTRNGTPCRRPAGWGTDHVGTGRCKLHGGKSTGPKDRGKAAASQKGNSKAAKHGFFRRIFPDDEETQAIINEIDLKSPLDILWENIVIQYTAIARAQKIMHVRDRDDVTKHLKRAKLTENTEEREREFQYAWDKQANFLQAQSRAMATLQGLIAKYEEMLPGALKSEEQRLKVEKLKAEITKLQLEDDDEDNLTALVDALKESARILKGEVEDT